MALEAWCLPFSSPPGGRLVLVCLACLPSRAQETQFLPEIDAHLELNSMFRTYLEAKNDRDGGDPQFTIGPSLQFYRKPLIKLKNVTTFDLDDTRSRFLVLETGYRYITAPDAAPENRMVTAVTFNYLGAGIRISDRNRADLDWKNGSFTRRYRNKLNLARTLRSTPITSSRMSPPSLITTASTASGAPRLSLRVACSLSASTWNSTATTSMTTTPASTRTSK
jgi:hypothetical protein